MKNIIKVYSLITRRNAPVYTFISARYINSNNSEKEIKEILNITKSEKTQTRKFNLINDKLKPTQEGVS